MKRDAGDRFTERLLREAEMSLRMVIAPYSGFEVGAAIASVSGKIYTGCNIENHSLMLSICAEKVALFKALSEGERFFRSIAIVSGDRRYCYPCGSCRQVLWEFTKDIDIFLSGEKGVKRYSLSELLPYPFSREFT